MYFFTQATPTSAWDIALASERDRITRERQPALTTVLDVDNAFDRDLTVEEYKSIKYFGPAYFDFDGESIEEVIPQFQALLNKLRDRKVSLDQVRMYATGGRGFHVEIPMGIFMPKPPVQGIAGLPHIYREMAHDLYVDLMDMRIYSAKKGRMWRCPGVKRDNGQYKVPITAEEALSITPEMYAQICSLPRPAIAIEPPVFSPDLGLLYAKSKDKVDASLRKAKNKKKTVNELKRFAGEWPTTVQSIFNGTVVKDGVGWNRIAMQLALTADALGKTEEQLLTDATPLLETYAGDSDRYGSFRKRKAHLQEMYRYLAGNITYDWSVGGLVALVTPGTDVSDLTNGEYVPDEDSDQDQAQAQAQPQDDEDDDEVVGAVRFSRSGIYIRDKDGEGWSKACHIGFAKPTQLMDIKTDMSIGYEVEVFVEGKSRGLHPLPLRAFAGRAKFQEWTMGWSVSTRGTDMEIAALADLLRRRTERSNRVMYQLNREGVDVVRVRGAADKDDLDIVFASAEGVLSKQGRNYRFASEFDSNQAGYTDLLQAPLMEDNEESRKIVNSLLNINTPLNMGLTLGWMSSAFLNQMIRLIGRAFPNLQIYGQAGAGKSALTEVLANLHYYLEPPRKLAASGQTQYPVIAAVTTSASTPVILEELKRREMSKHQIDFLLNVLRNNYDGSVYKRGGLGESGKGPVIHSFQSKAPLITLGEGLETQTAVLERSVVVALSKADRYGRGETFKWLEAKRHDLGKLGHQMVKAALATKLSELERVMNEKRNLVQKALGEAAEEGDASRPIYNYSIVLVGLEFLALTLREIFGDLFDEKVEELTQAVIANLYRIVPETRSEAAKVLDTLARLTREDDITYKLERGKDYTAEATHVDIKVKNAYAKYVRYCRSMGQQPLYDTAEAFIAAMTNYAGVLDTNCFDNPTLKHGPFDAVFRFSVEHMTKEKIEHFQP